MSSNLIRGTGEGSSPRGPLRSTQQSRLPSTLLVIQGSLSGGVNVIRVHHHGSRLSTAFLERSESIVSVAVGFAFDFPPLISRRLSSSGRAQFL